MERSIAYLKECQKNAANENQKEMIGYFINYFETGDVDDFKES